MEATTYGEGITHEERLGHDLGKYCQKQGANDDSEKSIETRIDDKRRHTGCRDIGQQYGREGEVGIATQGEKLLGVAITELSFATHVSHIERHKSHI